LQGQIPNFQKTSLQDFWKHAARTTYLTCLHHREFEKFKSQNIQIIFVNIALTRASWGGSFLTFLGMQGQLTEALFCLYYY
jgi:hypothetical protein